MKQTRFHLSIRIQPPLLIVDLSRIVVVLRNLPARTRQNGKISRRFGIPIAFHLSSSIYTAGIDVGLAVDPANRCIEGINYRGRARRFDFIHHGTQEIA
jgi:hypothetical protein